MHSFIHITRLLFSIYRITCFTHAFEHASSLLDFSLFGKANSLDSLYFARQVSVCLVQDLFTANPAPITSPLSMQRHGQAPLSLGGMSDLVCLAPLY